MARSALIIGVAGQDGAYLSRVLLDKGYTVVGACRQLSPMAMWRLQYLGVAERVSLIQADVTDGPSLAHAISVARPDEVYYLAAQGLGGVSFEQLVAVGDVNGLGVTRLLELLRAVCPASRLHCASSAEIFGPGRADKLDEGSPLEPLNPYACAKVYGLLTTRVYRRQYGLFVCSGILFNHESPLRDLRFVTRKISNSVARIALGLQTELRLGNLEAQRDWGYAQDFSESMWLMLQQDVPDDYVIATGETHSVAEFAGKAFEVAGLDWRQFVVSEAGLTRPGDPAVVCGDYGKAKQKLGWHPTVHRRWPWTW